MILILKPFFNPLLHRLFLDHDIIFYFKTTLGKKIKKNLSKVLNTFENIMENGVFAPKTKCSIFHNIFKYIFQRRQKALLRSKGLNLHALLSSGAWGLNFGMSLLHCHYFVCVSRQDSGKTPLMPRLVHSFTVHMWYEYQNLMNWLIWMALQRSRYGNCNYFLIHQFKHVL